MRIIQNFQLWNVTIAALIMILTDIKRVRIVMKAINGTDIRLTFRDLTGTLQHVGRTQTRAQAEGTKDIDSVGVCAHQCGTLKDTLPVGA